MHIYACMQPGGNISVYIHIYIYIFIFYLFIYLYINTPAKRLGQSRNFCLNQRHDVLILLLPTDLKLNKSRFQRS